MRAGANRRAEELGRVITRATPDKSSFADRGWVSSLRVSSDLWNRLCEAVSEWEEVRDAAFWRRVAPLLRRISS